jgi:hypothetical protein
MYGIKAAVPDLLSATNLLKERAPWIKKLKIANYVV